LYVASNSCAVEDFTQQDGPTIPQARNELAELMTGIGGGYGISALRYDVSRKNTRKQRLVE
jgi:hypothetical protein